MNDRTSCAHLTVTQTTIRHEDGTCSDGWVCISCGREFAPIFAPAPQPCAAEGAVEIHDPAIDMPHELEMVVCIKFSGLWYQCTYVGDGLFDWCGERMTADHVAKWIRINPSALRAQQ